MRESEASWIVCGAFLKKCSAERREKLLRLLPAEIRETALRETFKDPSQGIQEPRMILSNVHFTWLAPILRTYSEQEIRFLLGALAEEPAKALKKQLLVSSQIPNLTPLAQNYLEQQLCDRLLDPTLLPVECLPASPMNDLLGLDYNDLLSLIGFLGLHDLAVEVKLIIDTSKLKRIYAALSKKQLHYLKTLTQRKEPISFKPMWLVKWDGNLQTLKALLEQRGINRLAKSLYGQDKNLLWYVTRKFDEHRANVLTNLCKPLNHSRAVALLSEQVATLIGSMKHSNPESL